MMECTKFRFSSYFYAYDILNELKKHIDNFGFVSVAFLYNLMDMTPSANQELYGWTNLDSAVVMEFDDSVVLHLPQPNSLKPETLTSKMIKCEQCGGIFTPKTKNQIFCHDCSHDLTLQILTKLYGREREAMIYILELAEEAILKYKEKSSSVTQV